MLENKTIRFIETMQGLAPSLPVLVVSLRPSVALISMARQLPQTSNPHVLPPTTFKTDDMFHDMFVH
jgi:hypothetical protein